ncbi:MAG TPA: HAD-IIIC family phosphatase, partial [Polyangiaceae bacterium]|nr:HAD-IIIC family phosphatase [Polyangiaceae bacterium]
MLEQRLLGKIVRGIERDRHLTVGEKIRKGARLLSETALARVFLRDCTVGSGARVVGRMRVDNRGAVRVGDGFIVHSTFAPAELVTGVGGRIEIGSGVWINFGSVIAAKTLVRIGDGVMIGQHCIVSDVDVPELVHAGDDPGLPIEIGDGAWIAGRVTLRPGVKIGKGAVITAGSVVESDIADGVVAGGIPARVLRAATDGHATSGVAVPVDLENGARSPALAREQAPPRFSGTIVSDFTIDELADELRAGGYDPGLRVDVAPYGYVTQVLLQEPKPEASDYLVVWARAETAVPSFARAMAFEEVTEEELNSDVDAFCALVEGAAARYKFVFVPTWSLPYWSRGLGMLDARKGGVNRQLLAMNLRLCDALAKTSNVFVLSSERWFAAAGVATPSPKAWYLGKMAVPRAVMAEAAADIKAALSGLVGGARKLLVLDLDDTLWSGIVGDVGWEGLRLGGHDGVGEALVDFQRAVKNMKRRGIVLGIVSKNEESVALEAIRRHPEMVLREDDFVAWKINWTDKAQNIAELAAEINLGLQSVVFID